MIVIGSLFVRSAPREINLIFGYRTPASMKTRETWRFAHAYCGKLWLKIGCIILPISAGAMLFAIEKETAAIGIFGAVLSGVQLVFIIWSIISTEIALRKHFDESGNRID